MVVQDDDVRYTVPRKWGFVWRFARDPKVQFHLWAKAETISTLKSFKDSFRRRRGLIIADSYFEWRVNLDRKQKTPMRVHLPADKLFVIAGIWDSWGDPMDPLETCAVITRLASSAMNDIHYRMPVVLSMNAVDEWLDPRTSVERAEEIMKDSISSLMYHPVTTYVNKPGNDGPRCWELDRSIVV
jgi:putative SOS response-associated peptidase YedK